MYKIEVKQIKAKTSSTFEANCEMTFTAIQEIFAVPYW